MSGIGRLPVAVPGGVGVKIDGRTLTVKGPKGEPARTFHPPPGISFTAETPQKLRVSGVDKEVVGEMAAKIRALRVPDPYKAKGVKYAGEYVRRKPGKAGKVGAAKA